MLWCLCYGNKQKRSRLIKIQCFPVTSAVWTIQWSICQPKLGRAWNGVTKLNICSALCSWLQIKGMVDVLKFGRWQNQHRYLFWRGHGGAPDFWSFLVVVLDSFYQWYLALMPYFKDVLKRQGHWIKSHFLKTILLLLPNHQISLALHSFFYKIRELSYTISRHVMTPR